MGGVPKPHTPRELQTERFDSFPSDRRDANVRQMLGRKGEVWAPESGVDRLVVFRTSAAATQQSTR